MDPAQSPTPHTPDPLTNPYPIVSPATPKITPKSRLLERLTKIAPILIFLTTLYYFGLFSLLLTQVNQFASNKFFSNFYLSYPLSLAHILTISLILSIGYLLASTRLTRLQIIIASTFGIVFTIISKIFFVSVYYQIYQSRFLSINWVSYDILNSLFYKSPDFLSTLLLLFFVFLLFFKKFTPNTNLPKIGRVISSSLFILIVIIPILFYPLFTIVTNIGKDNLSAVQKQTPYQIITPHHPDFVVASVYSPNTLLYLPQAVSVTLEPKLSLRLNKDTRLVQFTQVSLSGKDFSLQTHVNKLSQELNTTAEILTLPSAQNSQAFYLNGKFLKYFTYITNRNVLVYLVSPTITSEDFIQIADSIY